MRPASIRMNVRVFSVFLIVGLLMLAIASSFVIGIGQAALRNSWGEHLRQVADQTAAAIDTYVFRLVIDASVLSRVPEVRELASTASQRPFDRAAAAATERDRQRAGQPAAAQDPAAAKVAGFLAEVTRQNPIYRELILTDRFGRTVAASGAVDGSFFGDSPWWKESFGDGTRGQLVVNDVRQQPRSQSWTMEIIAPVEDPSSGQVAGILRTTIDMRETGAILGGVRMGTTGDAALVREDGSFVFSEVGVEPNARFFATDLMRERLAVIKQGQPQTPLHFGATTAAGTPRLVGVAMSQLKPSFPHLAWIVAVSQGEDELFSPVRAQSTSLLVVLGLLAVAVLLFAFWYSIRLAAPPEPEEMDMHLTTHPRLHRIAESDEAATEERVGESV